MASKDRKALHEAIDKILGEDITEVNVSLCLASITDEDGLPSYRRVQLSDELADDFREVANRVLDKLWRANENSDLVVHPYDAGSKPDHHEIEYVNLDDQEVIAAQIKGLSGLTSMELFDESDESFVSGLRYYVIVLQKGRSKPIYCFRFYTPRMELGRSTKFAAIFSRGHYDRIERPVFLFDQHLDCFSQGSGLFVVRKDGFQKLFRFFEMVRKAAKRTLRRIKKHVPVANFDEFEEACEGHLQKLAKLKNIAAKPYLEEVTMDDLKRVIGTSGLDIEVVEKDGEEKLVFDPTDKWALLRLLDDDYLDSSMTGFHYEVTGKRKIR